MKYTSERKRTADDQMTKVTRRFKQNVAKDEGDYGDVPEKYKQVAPGPTYEGELRSEDEMDEEGRCWSGFKPVSGKKPYSKGSCEPVEEEMDNLLHVLINEARRYDEPSTKCAVCGGKHHPAAKHLARALAPENNVRESKSAEQIGKEVIGKFKRTHLPTGKVSHGDITQDHLTAMHGSYPNTRKGKSSAGDVVSHWNTNQPKTWKYELHDGMSEGERPTPAEMLRATIFKKSKDGKEVLDELGEAKKAIAEAKKKGPKWVGNSITIPSTQADINRKAAQTVGMPPPKKIIKSKKDKPAKYKERFDEAAHPLSGITNGAQYGRTLAKHGYKPTESLDSDYERYEHPDSSHVNVNVKNDQWEHTGLDKSNKNREATLSKTPTRGSGAHTLHDHLFGSARKSSTNWALPEYEKMGEESGAGKFQAANDALVGIKSRNAENFQAAKDALVGIKESGWAKITRR